MSPTRTTGPQQVKDAYKRVTQRIAESALRRGRQPSDILTIAVTRTASPDEIRLLCEMGHCDFAEPRLIQLPQRVTALNEFIGRRRFLSRGHSVDLPVPRWHLIAALPKGKAKQFVPLVRLVHTVDNLRVAEELHAHGARQSAQNGHDEADRPTDILLQVNATGREDYPGLALPALGHFAEQVDSMIHLRLRGLMVTLPRQTNSDDRREIYARVAEIFTDLKTSKYVGNVFNILSMGTSDDYEIAVEEGANLLRIGRAIFGDTET